MYLAIGLCQTDMCDEKGSFSSDQLIYTSKCATFEYENTALEFAGNHDYIMIIDTDTGNILKDATVVVEVDKS